MERLAGSGPQWRMNFQVQSHNDNEDQNAGMKHKQARTFVHVANKNLIFRSKKGDILPMGTQET